MHELLCKQIVLRRSAPSERLGLGIAIESDDEDNRVLSVRVEQVDACSIASRSGLQVGDRVCSVAGTDVHQCSRMECLALLQQPTMTVTLVITRRVTQNTSVLSDSRNLLSFALSFMQLFFYVFPEACRR
ncbi:unnamed protein product [Gongylonema pulchrum]|uniref:PDZ domain-containing protein n=1 Tax=Gongylonema pulchrum TaxID=637853 RepID=A0A183EKK1_9BILA|nr:unnamed protein product [Gongylonema pulchrum]VDN45207.1 unnamed protein product [Gongylonema pulchrum]